MGNLLWAFRMSKRNDSPDGGVIWDGAGVPYDGDPLYNDLSPEFQGNVSQTIINSMNELYSELQRVGLYFYDSTIWYCFSPAMESNQNYYYDILDGEKDWRDNNGFIYTDATICRVDEKNFTKADNAFLNAVRKLIYPGVEDCDLTQTGGICEWPPMFFRSQDADVITDNELLRQAEAHLTDMYKKMIDLIRVIYNETN
jgi:hypothetical protein